MTREEAKANQDDIIARGFKLEWWYSTKSTKCCGVFPKFVHVYGVGVDGIKLQCEVCGRETKVCVMPWIAEEEWKKEQERQLSIFEFME